MSILVLGLGNILLSDEGVGVRIVEALDAAHELPAEVEVLDGG
ncbi:MAG: hydrogenase 2 maturation endopeptidase, partial [Ignavibacteria bacterium]